MSIIAFFNSLLTKSSQYDLLYLFPVTLDPLFCHLRKSKTLVYFSQTTAAALTDYQQHVVTVPLNTSEIDSLL